METNKSEQNIVIVGAILVLVFLGVLLINKTGSSFYKGVNKELNNLKLIPIPETFTELYFENHSSLPKKSVAGTTDFFSFTIHNMEWEKKDYQYSVYFEYPSGFRVLFTSGTVTLNHDQYKIIGASHKWYSSDLIGQVVVELIGRNQKIDFILPNNN